MENPNSNPQNRHHAGEFAIEYEKRPKELVHIMNEAKKLMEQMEHSPNLKPEAVAKVMREQRDIYLKAREELQKIQEKNAEEITKNVPKPKPKPH